MIEDLHRNTKRKERKKCNGRNEYQATQRRVSNARPRCSWKEFRNKRIFRMVSRTERKKKERRKPYASL